jgi:SagB-type dehydrogenase family enzyme
MNRTIATILAGTATVAAFAGLPDRGARAQQGPGPTIKLPEARRQGTMSLEAALWARHSTRSLSRDSISLADVGQLLWAAQGVNRPDGHRTAPSAGATYPLELYLVAARVKDLAPGVYHYVPQGHQLETVAAGDRLQSLVDSATHQAWQADAAAVVVFAAAYERAARRFRERAERYVPMDVGFAGQNLYLQAAALGLGTTFAGSFQDSALAAVVGLPAGQRPLGVMAVGRPR